MQVRLRRAFQSSIRHRASLSMTHATIRDSGHALVAGSLRQRVIVLMLRPARRSEMQRSDQLIDVASWEMDEQFGIFPVGSKPKRLMRCPEGVEDPFLIA